MPDKPDHLERSQTYHQLEKNTQTIRSIFTDKGYNEAKLNALAYLFHITGGIDGMIKSAPPSNEEIRSILENPVTADQLNVMLQKNYFQKYRAGERQQIESCPELTQHKDTIPGLFKTLGYIDAVVPSKAKYDIAFVYGCAQAGLEERIKSLKSLQTGSLLIGQTPLKVGQVFILAGDRPLWPDKEDTAVQLFAERTGIAANVIQAQINAIFTPEVRARNDAKEINTKRIEAVKLLTTQYDKSWPTEADMARELARTMLHGQALSIVDAMGRNGKRPDTLDTVAAWNDKFGCEIKAPGKSILAISNQPYIPEQYVPLGVLDPRKFSFEVVGSACDPDTVKPESLLAAFAGGFYKELQLEKFKTLANEEKDRILPDRRVDVNHETRRHGYNGIYNPNKAPLSMTR